MVLLPSDIRLMFHPGHQGEMGGQAVVEFSLWDLNGRRLAIEGEDLVLLLAIICGQGLGPVMGGWGW